MGRCSSRRMKQNSDTLLLAFRIIVNKSVSRHVDVPYFVFPLGDSLGPRARAHWAHLGDSFDEVISFITALAFPGCADGSVSSSDQRTTKYEP